MDLREIDIVCELVNYKSFKEAAQGLCCSSSVITKYVANIERELGLKLFVRGNKSTGLTLTPEGKEVMNSLRLVRDDFHYTMELCKRLRNKGHTVLAIGMQPRFGTKFETHVISRYLQEHPEIELRVYKATVSELAAELRAGKIGALFATLYKGVDPVEYFQDQTGRQDLGIDYISAETDMYCGISERYLPGKSEATLRELRDFTFALPFPLSGDIQETQALMSWQQQAEAAGFELKAMNFSALGDSILRLALEKQVAICSTNVPLKHDGIKFVRIKDWTGGARLYLVYRKGNMDSSLLELRRIASSYSAIELRTINE